MFFKVNSQPDLIYANYFTRVFPFPYNSLQLHQVPTPEERLDILYERIQITHHIPAKA